MSREIFGSALAALSLLLTTVVSTASASGPDEGSVANSCVVFRLTPVKPPPGQPPYPPGTIVDSDNNTITLRGSGEQTVWFDVMISDWGCVGILKTWQASIGSDALLPPGVEGIHLLCSGDADCANAGFGPVINQGLGQRGAWCVDTVNPNECSSVWEDENRPDWLAFDVAVCDFFNRSCGGTGLNTPDYVDDGTERYGMTVALSIDTSVDGVVQIPFNESQTFMIEASDFKPTFPGKAIPATVIVDASIPTVSAWGLVVLSLGLLAVAKARSTRPKEWVRS